MDNTDLFINDLYLFYRYFIASDYKDSVPAPHIKQLAHELMKLMVTDEYHRLAVSMPPRHLLADSTPILTHNRGWTTHGDLKIGDYVYGLDGKPTKIIGISPKQECDRLISFSNGSQILAHECHLWSVYRRGNKKLQVLPTKEMEDNFSYTEKNGKKRYRYHLPLIEPIQFTEKELPIDPYWLGLWLGDGTYNKPCITHSEEDNQFIDKVPYEVSSQSIHKDTNVCTTYFSNQGLLAKIKELDLYENKHIPQIYKEASFQQRLELLAGLIDSDGNVDKKGRVRFINTNKQLIDDVYELCCGLGLYPYLMKYEADKINEYKKNSKSLQIKSKKDCYHIGFQPRYSIPTTVPRKKIIRKGLRRKLSITNIEKTDNAEMGKCIEIENEDGIYLVGKEMIPTHNSKSSMVTLSFPLWLIFQNPNLNILIITVGALTEKFGIKIREYVREYGGAFNCYLSDVKQASTHIMFCDKDKHLYKGSIRLTGIGGSVTGQDADVVILDDPYKGLEEEFSPTALQKKIDWVNRVLEQRIEPHTRYCVLHTRWHPIQKDYQVLTHNRGWTTHGDLQVGDYVYTPNMKPTMITQVGETIPIDNTLVFSNDEKVVCGDDHLWTVQNTKDGSTHTYTTTQLWSKNKHEPVHKIFSKADGYLTLKNCFKSPSVQGNCITIDDPLGVYLIGEKMVATHNSRDIIGYYRETQPHLFKFINFSAITDDGTPLWKERYGIDELMTKKENMGERMFSAIYQQVPLDMTSDYFTMERIKYNGLDDDETIVKKVRSWDISGSESMSADYTSGALVSLTNKGNIILEDIVHGKYGNRTVEVIKSVAEHDTPSVPILVETGVAGAGMLLFQSWKEQLEGFMVIQSKPIKSKVDRATPLRNVVFDGQLKVLLGSGMRQVFLDEFSTFPNGEHDDIVDSVSYGVNWLKYGDANQRKRKPGLVRIRR